MNEFVVALLDSAIKSDLPWCWRVEDFSGVIQITYQVNIVGVTYSGGIRISKTVLNILCDSHLVLDQIQYSINSTEMGLRESGVY